MISKHTIDLVFETARVEEVIGEFVQLKKSGSNFKGLSPFSDERTPSFMVSPAKQIWKDFSSGKGGNVLSFLMEHEHFSYPEAIRFLAKKYNIEIEETVESPEQQLQNNERESLFVVSEYANLYFQDILFNHPKGKAIGLSYFQERGYREDIIKKFQLGYCLDEWDAFTKDALSKGYELDYLDKTGLTIVKEDKQFDRFKGRVLFPIHSMSGRVLGFGGRTLSADKNIAKYVNSPESEIYHKSQILYGIFHAKKEIVKEDNCYLVEGYTDVISLHQAGIENVVASSGTALTPEQIRLIRRLTNNITVLFDGDSAGIKAAIRGVDLILEEGMNVRVLTFPDGDDPDSFSKKVSSEELKDYLQNNSKDFINYKVSLLLEDAKNDPVKKAALIRDIVNSIAKISDNIQREIYVQECAQLMHISEEVLFNELAQLHKKELKELHGASFPEKKSFKVLKAPSAEETQETFLQFLEREIIKLLLLHGNSKLDFIDWEDAHDERGRYQPKEVIHNNSVFEEIYLQLQADEIEFTHELFRSIYYEIINLFQQNGKIVSDALVNHAQFDISKEVTNILMEDEKHVIGNWAKRDILIKPKDDQNEVVKSVTDCILNLRRNLVNQKISELKNQFSENTNGNNNESLDLIMKYKGLEMLLSDKLGREV
ncbi:MAG: DNA primase [Flavobacteriaceae bacterium]|nr:DNA primase [Flavobacteriaceae bacterium]